MIAKVSSGRSFGGLARYLEEGSKEAGLEPGERVAWAEARNLPTAEIRYAGKLMAATVAANDNSRAEKPVYHLSIAWDAKDNPTPKQMSDTAGRLLKDLGLADHQALIVAHNDGATPHLHIVVNRIGPDGRAWDRSHDFRRIEQSLRAVEREMGWREVAGRHHQLDGQTRPDRAQMTPGQLRHADRTGQVPFAQLVAEAAGDKFRTAQSWQQLHADLREQGLQLVKLGRGLTVTDGTETAKASSIDRAASLSNLEKRLGPYESTRPGHTPGQGGSHPAPANHDRSGPTSRPDFGRPGRDLGADGRGRGQDQGLSRPDGSRTTEAMAPPSGDNRGNNPDRSSGRNDRRNNSGRPRLADDRPGSDRPLDFRDALNRAEVLNAATIKWRSAVTIAMATITIHDQKRLYASKLREQLKDQFQKVYGDQTDRALSNYDRAVKVHGIRRASQELEQHPESYGRVKGKGIWIFRTEERKEARTAAIEAAHAARKSAAMDKAVANHQPAADKAAKNMAKATKELHRTQASQTPEASQALKDLARAARDLPADTWRSLGEQARALLAEGRALLKADRSRATRPPEPRPTRPIIDL